MTKVLLYGFVWTFAGFCAEPVDTHWPQFRGPGGLGLGNDKSSPPSEFGPGKSLLWKTALSTGHGSPCIWGNRIFVTGFDSGAKKPETIAIDRKSGKIVWRQTIPATELEQVHSVSSPATSTPVTDGERVYVYSGSYGLLAYDWDGKLEWDYPMGIAKSPFGSGTSPVLAGDLVLVARDYPPDPFLLAIGKKDGKLAWKKELAKATQMGSRTAHSTPIIWKDQIVLNRPGEVAGYSPKDGARLWWFPTASPGTSSISAGSEVLYVNAPGMGTDTYTLMKLPPYADALKKYDTNKDGKLSAAEAPAADLFFMKRGGVPDDVPGAHFTIKSFFRTLDMNKDGFVDETEYNFVGMMMGMVDTRVTSGVLSIRPAGEGALAKDALQWAELRGAAEVTTPLEYRGRLYAVNAGGIVSCMDAKTGKLIYRGRVNAPGAYFASPVAAGGKVFVASGDGVVTVLGGGETLEILANNDLGEPVYGTPALVESTIYVRSSGHLWAFGGK